MIYKLNTTCNMNIIAKTNQFWLCSKIPRLQIDVLTYRLKVVFFLQVLSPRVPPRKKMHINAIYLLILCHIVSYRSPSHLYSLIKLLLHCLYKNLLFFALNRGTASFYCIHQSMISSYYAKNLSSNIRHKQW